MGSPNWRHRLERDFTFAPRRDGAGLALRLLELSGQRDLRVQRRLDAWLHATAPIMPDIRTGNAELDGTPADDVVAALMLRLGARDLTPTGSSSGLLHAGAVIDGLPPGEALRLVRAALTAARRPAGHAGRS